MIIRKIVTSETQEDIRIKDVTLLSMEEYQQFKNRIKPISSTKWWLKTPGKKKYNVMCISEDGACINFCAGLGWVRIRPVIIFISSNLNVGDQFELADNTWTVVAEGKALCDNIIGQTWFRKTYEAEDANIYDVSDVKKYLGSWVRKQKIIIDKGEAE